MRLASLTLLCAALAASAQPFPAPDGPSIAITSPAPSSTQKTTFTLAGTSTKAPSGGGVTVTVGQVVNGVEVPVKGGTYTTTVNAKTGTWSVDITLPVGSGYTIYASLDNTSNPIQVDEVYDITVTAPVCGAVLADDIDLAISYPLANATFKLGTTPYIFTNATLNNGTSAWVYVEVQGTDAGNTYYYGDAHLAYSGMNLFWTLPNSLPVGTYRANVSSDAQGTSHSVTFTVTP